MESPLVLMCVEAATESVDAIEMWRRQRRTLVRLPSHLAMALFRRLLHRRLLFPALLEVFKYSIEEVDLSGESCVDAEWMAYIGAYQCLQSLVLEDCCKITNSSIWNLSGMENLKELDLSRCSKITDAGIKHLLSISTLEKLCITGTGVTAKGAAALSSLTNLKILDLGSLPVTDVALRSLQALLNLEYLDISESEVSNAGVTYLMNLPRLSFLNIGWTNVTHLPNFPSLACLNMSNCTVHSVHEGDYKPLFEKVILSGAILDISKVFLQVDTSRLSFFDLSGSSINSFNFLSSMNALADLNLSDCPLYDDSMQHIASIGPSLKYLNLTRTKTSSEGVKQLAGKFPSLETLVLFGTAVDDTALPYISLMTSLKSIDLSCTYVKGMVHGEGTGPDKVPSLSALGALKNLERLYLEEINAIDPAISLKGLSKLSHLFLRNSWLMDASLHDTSSFPNLVHVGLRDSVLTDSGLLSFVPPSTMEVLDLRGCWLLSQNAILCFRRKYPQIETRHDFVDAHGKRNPGRSPPSGGQNESSNHKLKQCKPRRLPQSLNGIKD